MRHILLAAGFALLSAPLQAQSVVEDCSTWQASARNVPEPWEQYTRTFANGAVRVALLDTIEPAAGAFYLMVQTPPYDELGSRVCVLIMDDSGMGLAGIEFAQIQAGYNPSVGLQLWTPVQVFSPNTGGYDPAILALTINQATGDVFARYEIP